MSNKDTGGAAFPSPTANPIQDGQLTVRDWFAGQALAGLATRLNSELVKKWRIGDGDGREAVVAYKLADAMLKERAK